jgi:hypothetical protein
MTLPEAPPVILITAVSGDLLERDYFDSQNWFRFRPRVPDKGLRRARGVTISELPGALKAWP